MLVEYCQRVGCALEASRISWSRYNYIFEGDAGPNVKNGMKHDLSIKSFFIFKIVKKCLCRVIKINNWMESNGHKNKVQKSLYSPSTIYFTNFLKIGSVTCNLHKVFFAQSSGNGLYIYFEILSAKSANFRSAGFEVQNFFWSVHCTVLYKACNQHDWRVKIFTWLFTYVFGIWRKVSEHNSSLLTQICKATKKLFN